MALGRAQPAWLLTAVSLLLQEGEDKKFLIQRIHSIYDHKVRCA